jgi:hypothetical protein
MLRKHSSRVMFADFAQDEAERVVWSEPGVSYVDNRHLVDWLYVA